jgi:hypothetical protein
MYIICILYVYSMYILCLFFVYSMYILCIKYDIYTDEYIIYWSYLYCLPLPYIGAEYYAEAHVL